jgi:broad specificity phosphatase PhoE
MAREIELRRHTDSDGDALTDEGVQAALDVGRSLRGGYDLLVSSGAQRATQTLACFACALGERVPGGALVEPGLRSELEDRWRQAYREAGRVSSRLCGRPTRSSSRRTRRPWEPRCGGCSTA